MKTYFYFDPERILDKNTYDQQWRDVHLYMPGVLLDHDDSKGESKLRLPGGEVVRVSSAGLVRVQPQDLDGVPDILQLDNFSEQSLVHTIRERFHRASYVLMHALYRSPPTPRRRIRRQVG